VLAVELLFGGLAGPAQVGQLPPQAPPAQPPPARSLFELPSSLSPLLAQLVQVRQVQRVPLLRLRVELGQRPGRGTEQLHRRLTPRVQVGSV
jgi:hypothetical protein